MDSVETSVPRPGLRERKKQQTREKIERVALRLFAKRGYDETTLAEIAEAADVSPRTIFGYFDSKEDILFCEQPEHIARMKEMLEHRPEGTTTVDALRAFIASVPPPDERQLLLKKIVARNPDLAMKLRAKMAQLEPVLAESIAKDLGAGPDDIRARLVASSMMTAFTTMSDRLEAGGQGASHEEVMEILDQVLEFLRGGLDALMPAAD